MIDWGTPELNAIAERATAKAAADVAAAIVEIARKAETAPDWEVVDDASGKRLLTMPGQMARGMLAHLRRSSGSEALGDD